MNMRLFPLALALIASTSCAVGGRAVMSQREVADLWQEPTDLERRDLFYGQGGRALAPSAAATYTLVEADTDGFSAGYDVRDGQGRMWSVKLGPESQTEVVASRLLWAVGYHQPAVYYLPEWTLTKDGARSSQSPGRFRLEPANEENLGEWEWRNNPFVGTRPFEGLFVLMVMINNWDLKPLRMRSIACHRRATTRGTRTSSRTWVRRSARRIGCCPARATTLKASSRNGSSGRSKAIAWRSTTRVGGASRS